MFQSFLWFGASHPELQNQQFSIDPIDEASCTCAGMEVKHKKTSQTKKTYIIAVSKTHMYDPLAQDEAHDHFRLMQDFVWQRLMNQILQQ